VNREMLARLWDEEIHPLEGRRTTMNTGRIGTLANTQKRLCGTGKRSPPVKRLENVVDD